MTLRNYFDRVVLIKPEAATRPAEACAYGAPRGRLALQATGNRRIGGNIKRWTVMPPECQNTLNKDRVRGAACSHCLLSHKGILEKALADKVRNMLILEDDICLIQDFRAQVAAFLQEVPDDWDQLMIGGQHMMFTGEPVLLKPGVFRCVGTERTHCYAVRGDYIQRLIEKWTGGGKFNGDGHCDWIMGRDPDLQPKHKVYAPEFFLAGQERMKSDINGRVTPRQFWNPPGPELPVINLHAPRAVVDALRAHGIHTGYDRERLSNVDNGLIKVFSHNGGDPEGREQRLNQWIKVIQWEAASDSRLICTVWHPLATPELVKAASLWKVYEVTADSVESALRQLPKALRRPAMPELMDNAAVSPHYFDRRPEIMNQAQNPLARPPQPPVPTTAQMAKNFTRAMAGWAKAGFKTVKRKVYVQRQAICAACAHWQSDARFSTGMCRKCGCSGMKLWLATSRCPDSPPRWETFASALPAPNDTTDRGQRPRRQVPAPAATSAP